ncbi:MAG: penicillin-binding protein 1C, partial [Candidatus Eremiobacteraeota bacterium]|nr:penicillin-binding protein 1C [Candidatus Eremiobacteraeota bacterium]
LVQVKDKGVTNGSAIVFDNHTGEILAMVGSADYFSRVRHGQVNGCLSLRQPGSTMKPFTYALALESGYTAADIIPDIPLPGDESYQGYSPLNYDKTYHGPVRLREALACSYNVAAVNLVKKIGIRRLLNWLRNAGFSHLDKSASFYGPGLTLGAGEVTLLELARAYSIFARGGEWIPEKFIISACDTNGDEIELPEMPGAKNLLDPETAYIITDILGDQQARAPAFGQWCVLNFPFPCAAKTGTSKAFRDNWTVGYTTDYTVAVWVGNFDGKEMKRVSGITGAGPLFREIMLALHKNAPPRDFPKPDGLVTIPVCPDSGEIPGKYCRNYIMEIFTTKNMPGKTCSVHRAIAIDSMTGQPPTPDTPAERLAEKVYRVFPPIYDEWMSKNGEEILSAKFKKTNHKTLQPGKPEICRPSHGSIYVRDPILRKEFQTIVLSAISPGRPEHLAWYVDGKLYSQENKDVVRWQLRPGRHVFEAEVSFPTGDKVRSSPVEILVL